MENERIIFEIILHGGNGRSCSMEAIHAAKQGDFSQSREKLKQAAEALNEAHHIQTLLIQEEINGKSSQLSLLMIHAQDHLMNAMTVRDLAAEIVELYQKNGSPGGTVS
jgi:cellobiose PTS system EIIA component